MRLPLVRVRVRLSIRVTWKPHIREAICAYRKHPEVVTPFRCRSCKCGREKYHHRIGAIRRETPTVLALKRGVGGDDYPG